GDEPVDEPAHRTVGARAAGGRVGDLVQRREVHVAALAGHDQRVVDDDRPGRRQRALELQHTGHGPGGGVEPLHGPGGGGEVDVVPVHHGGALDHADGVAPLALTGAQV